MNGLELNQVADTGSCGTFDPRGRALHSLGWNVFYFTWFRTSLFLIKSGAFLRLPLSPYQGDGMATLKPGDPQSEKLPKF